MPKRIIILSLDGMGTDDYRSIEDLDGFRYLTENGSYCENVRSVYPSLTYPAHASIVSGKLPKNHGIVNNTKIQPHKVSPDWFWYRKDLKGETIYDIAKKQKRTVASFLWPVAGRSSIKWNLPEIFPVRPFQNMLAMIASAGNLTFSLELDKLFGKLRRGIQQPYLDDFTHESSLYSFLKYQPYMTLVHYVDLDWQRHHKGFASIEATEAILRYGKRVNDWVNLLKKEGILEESLLVVLSDHSHLPCHTVIRPNVYLKDLGLIKLIEDDIVDYRAYFKSCDGSGYIYLDNPKDEALKSRLRDELMVLSAYERNGIESFIEADKASTLGADPTCSFMLEAREGYYFSESPVGSFIESLPEEVDPQSEYLLSTHGYSPYKKDYDPVFFMAGPGVKKGYKVDRICLVDEGPTIARLMGSSLLGVDGRILYEMLDNIMK